MKYKIKFLSAWESPQYFETNSKEEAEEIIFEGHRSQYLVYLNEEKQTAIKYKVR
jgi:hypothetical protein|tara:strand:+ start:838 stop:1002 length:165 start_codon:yes stop_codon:yes gene_type:complete